MMRPAVFLDRDGVINRAIVRDGVPRPPASLEDLEILPGVAEALGELKANGYVLVVVTNQPDVARGTLSAEMVGCIHERLKSELDLDAILACLHDTADACDCRKPKPGMLLRAARVFDLDLSSSFMVGDRWQDVEAGRRAGCRTFFVDYHYDGEPANGCDFRVGSLIEASRIITAQSSCR